MPVLDVIFFLKDLQGGQLDVLMTDPVVAALSIKGGSDVRIVATALGATQEEGRFCFLGHGNCGLGKIFLQLGIINDYIGPFRHGISSQRIGQNCRVNFFSGRTLGGDWAVGLREKFPFAFAGRFGTAKFR